VFFIIRKKMLVVFAALCACLAVMAVLPAQEALLAADAGAELPRILVIDPGHGGEDGGTVAADGTTEAAINLAVALRLREVCFLCGVEPVMTREEDVSIHTEGDTIRARKASDIRNRVALVNSYPNAVLISIHQNSLPQAKSVHGAQVFYNKTAGSETLSHALQQRLNRAVNTDRAKEMRPIDPSVYLMKHSNCAAVLVECGFLSNAGEAEQLKTPSHQKKIALSVAAGYFAWADAEQEDL